MTSLNLFSQELNKNSIFIRTSLNYSQTNDDQSDFYQNIFVLNNTFENTKTQAYNSGLTVGKRFKNGLYCGVGIWYFYTKTNTNIEEEQTDNMGLLFSHYYHNSNINTTTISPAISFGYNKNLIKKLSISFEFYAKYNFTKMINDSESYYYEYDSTGVHKYTNNKLNNTELESLGIGLFPSLKYEINNVLGIELAFGNVYYQTKTKDSRYFDPDKKTNQFNIDFKPSNWILSFYVQF